MGKCLSKNNNNDITPANGSEPIGVNYFETLRNAKQSQYTDFSFNGLSRTANVVSAYDGDTCRVVFFLHEPPVPDEKPVMTNVRLMGIDTPELRTKDLKEKELGYKAKDRLIELVGGEKQLIRVVFGKNGKYGRPLATLFTERDKSSEYYVFENSVNAKMVSEGHAKKYDGGTKESWSTNTKMYPKLI